MTGNTGPGCVGNIQSSIYISICTCVSKTDGLVVTDSPRVCSYVCQVPGGSVTCVYDRMCRLVQSLIVGDHIALTCAKRWQIPCRGVSVEQKGLCYMCQKQKVALLSTDMPQRG